VSNGTARWLAPVGASAAVLAVLAVPGVLLSAADGSGPGPGFDAPTAPPDDVAPSRPAETSDNRHGGVREVEIVSYEAEGRSLRLYYTVDQSSDCSSRIEPPAVRETADAVVVRLDRRPSRAPDQVCTHLLLTNTVDVPLGRPLGRRVLQDASRAGALVPVHGNQQPMSDPPTPPLSRQGR
jgi:hypothetical protein